MRVGCWSCGNTQEYKPRGNKISRNPSTKCKKCGDHIRVKKPLIHIQCKEVRNKHIIFEDRLKEVPRQWLEIVPLDHIRRHFYEIDVDFGKFKVHFQDLAVEKLGSIKYGKIYVKKFNNLDHVELYYDRINYVFKPLKDSLVYYDECKELSLKLKKRMTSIMGLKIQDYEPKLISPPRKDLFTMRMQQTMEDIKREISQITKEFLLSAEEKEYSKKPPDTYYI